MRRFVLQNKMICHILEGCNKELIKDPTNIELLKTRAMAYNLANKNLKAIEDLRKVLTALPEDASSYYLKSDCHLQLGQIEEAKKDFMRATLLEDNPNIEKKYIENVLVPEETELSEIEKILEYERNKAILSVFSELTDESKGG